MEIETALLILKRGGIWAFGDNAVCCHGVGHAMMLQMWEEENISEVSFDLPTRTVSFKTTYIGTESGCHPPCLACHSREFFCWRSRFLSRILLSLSMLECARGPVFNSKPIPILPSPIFHCPCRTCVLSVLLCRFFAITWLHARRPPRVKHRPFNLSSPIRESILFSHQLYPRQHNLTQSNTTLHCRFAPTQSSLIHNTSQSPTRPFHFQPLRL